MTNYRDQYDALGGISETINNVTKKGIGMDKSIAVLYSNKIENERFGSISNTNAYINIIDADGEILINLDMNIDISEEDREDFRKDIKTQLELTAGFVELINIAAEQGLHENIERLNTLDKNMIVEATKASTDTAIDDLIKHILEMI